MFLTPTDQDEVKSILNTLKPKKSSGHDNISTSFLKQIATEISYPISKLINKSFEEGIVPNIFNIAKVIPIHKSKDKDIFQL